ncbi:MAG TPA: nucleoside-diphosphate sugar epimerase/dehydratase [Armatimonadota bacterium]|jgi:FlaA1/EpsC-like NDP-sugar epimerase
MRLTLPRDRVIGIASSLLLAGYDVAAILGATVMAIILRFEYLRFEFLEVHFTSLPFVLATYLLTYYFFRLYRYRWQFAGVEMLWSVLLANCIATMISVFWQDHIDGQIMPRSIVAMTCVLATALVGGQRMLLRVIAVHLDRRHHGKPVAHPWDTEPKRTVIVGSGRSAADVLNALSREHPARCTVVGILDEDPRHHGSYLRGIKILGGYQVLHDLVNHHEIDEVIVAMPDGSSAQLREHVLACCENKVAVRMVPVIAELLDNPSASRGHLKLVNMTVEDLLRRQPMEIDLATPRRFLTGKRILVTGAGGSIGSELCRQISQMNPALLVLLGHGENSLHKIKVELGHHSELAGRIVTVICDVRDADRLEHLFTHFKPQVVFHAAAHKHVPLMEENLPEAISNNVGGTLAVLQTVLKAGAERLVLISSDKAVRPSSVMGASKFMCEEILRAHAHEEKTALITVRFGNVLGSRGSVLPLFQEQILRGGPVTITHPEMNRYFMTIPEAVSLVLEASARGHSGSLFVLDMGEPIRIIDLAENVIRLSGLEPYRDIAIEYCGLRPGEKITEELFTDMEATDIAVPCDRLMMVDRPQYIRADGLQQVVDDLLEAARRNDDAAILRLLAAAIPSFRQLEGKTVPLKHDREEPRLAA